MNPAPHNWCYVYLLKNRKDGSIYIGCTTNLYKRLKEHKEGKNNHTRKMLPVELAYFEAYKSKKDAFEREKRLKYHGSAMKNLKKRLQATIHEGGAG